MDQALGEAWRTDASNLGLDILCPCSSLWLRAARSWLTLPERGGKPGAALRTCARRVVPISWKCFGRGFAIMNRAEHPGTVRWLQPLPDAIPQSLTVARSVHVTCTDLVKAAGMESLLPDPKAYVCWGEPSGSRPAGKCASPAIFAALPPPPRGSCAQGRSMCDKAIASPARNSDASTLQSQSLLSSLSQPGHPCDIQGDPGGKRGAEPGSQPAQGSPNAEGLKESLIGHPGEACNVCPVV